jgi:hypothetical protein
MQCRSGRSCNIGINSAVLMPASLMNLATGIDFVDFCAALRSIRVITGTLKGSL